MKKKPLKSERYTKSVVAEKTEEIFYQWKVEIPEPKYIALLSPFYYQYIFFKELFPNSKIFVFDIKSWNINDSKNFNFDLISASSVFMYSSNPHKWFKNIFKCCKFFWIQDLIDSKRSKEGILGADGDKARFSFSPALISSYPYSFDLAVFKNRINDFVDFPVGDTLHFFSSFKGDLNHVSSPNINFNAILRDIWFKLKYRIK